jgi:peptidoglycan/LPS O-acetylase OafA/YrhL
MLLFVFAWGTMTSVMYFGPLLMLLGGEGWIARALATPFFRRAATLGYGVYLVHMPIVHYGFMPIVRDLHHRGVSMALVWPLAFVSIVVCSHAVAYLLHVFIEKPALQLRERFAA